MTPQPPLAPGARARAVTESATLAIAGRAKELRAEGKDVVSLSTGEPDFPTPPSVRDAGCAAIQEGDTRYTAASGIPELRAAAAEWLGAEFGLSFGPAEVMVTAGAKAGLHMALQTVLEPGERVLLPAPYWVSYPDLVGVAGGAVEVLPPVPEQGFVHTGAQIDAAARRSGARGLILNFPNNPSGAVPTRAQVQDIVEAAAANDLWILSDEIYGKLTYDGAEHVSPATIPAGHGRTLVVTGATKSHSFTGWRLAFLAGPAEVIAAAGRIQSQVLGNPCTISQRAALAICRGDFADELAARARAFDERRRYLVDALDGIDGMSVSTPQGAFYVLVDVSALCDRRGVDDVGLSRLLLDEALLAVVPGSAFAIPGYVRLSYAASMDDLREAVARLERFAGADA